MADSHEVRISLHRVAFYLWDKQDSRLANSSSSALRAAWPAAVRRSAPTAHDGETVQQLQRRFAMGLLRLSSKFASVQRKHRHVVTAFPPRG